MKKEDLKKQDGFTMVELVIALTLLLLVALSFVPMFVYISEGSQNNRVRLIALKLASSKIEEIRALPYDQIGTVGGNPAGVILQEEKKDINGITFTIKTDISWLDDPYDDDGSGYDPFPDDYKRVKVTVESPSLFTGSVVKTADINTLVAEEGEEKVRPGGNIKVKVQRASSGSQPVEGVKIVLLEKDDPSNIQTGFTDCDGQKLYTKLDEGDYIVKADAGIQGMMVRPDQAEVEVSVIKGVTKPCAVEVEYPSYLEIKLVDRNTLEPVVTDGSLTLSAQNMSFPTKKYNFNTDTSGVISYDVIGKLWPTCVYDVIILVDGYFPYSLKSDPNPNWDGMFSYPGQKKRITIELTSLSDIASVTVIDDQDGNPVTGANVEVYEHEYIYQHGSWVSKSCTLVNRNNTDENGAAYFDLNDSISKPDLPVDNDRYTCYCVHVSKYGYKNMDVHNAFWVSGGKQISEAGEINAYEVNLVPYLGKMHVTVKKRRGWRYVPAPKESITVQGSNSFEQMLKTDDNGVAVFNNLRFGEYHVYLDGSSQIKPVDVVKEDFEFVEFIIN
jgi:prepilin-type N-terminal cleavage/methylation domain-containing protein